MRDFFIRWLERLIGVVVILFAIGVVVGAGAALFGQGPNGEGGILAALLILVVGAIYVVFLGGFMYLGLGIYQNTKRMAEALERNNT